MFRVIGQQLSLHKLGYEEWLLAGPGQGGGSAEDMFRYQKRNFRVQRASVWALQCTSDVPTADGYGLGRFNMGNLFGLPG